MSIFEKKKTIRMRDTFLRGISGKGYRFFSYRLPPPDFLEDLAAVYVYANMAGSMYKPIYIGETDYIATSIIEQKSSGLLARAVEHGATYFLVHYPRELGIALPKTIQADLLGHYTTPCND